MGSGAKGSCTSEVVLLTSVTAGLPFSAQRRRSSRLRSLTGCRIGERDRDLGDLVLDSLDGACNRTSRELVRTAPGALSGPVSSLSASFRKACDARRSAWEIASRFDFGEA